LGVLTVAGGNVLTVESDPVPMSSTPRIPT
jgi:hypothetical protein